MQEHAAECTEIDRSNGGRDVVYRAVNHARARFVGAMRQPICIVELANVELELATEPHEVRAIRDDVDHVGVRQVVGDNVGAGALHMEADEAARGSDLQYALASDIDAAEIVANPALQVPLAFNEPVPRQLDGVIEVTVAQIGDDARRRIQRVGRRCVAERDVHALLVTHPA